MGVCRRTRLGFSLRPSHLATSPASRPEVSECKSPELGIRCILLLNLGTSRDLLLVVLSGYDHSLQRYRIRRSTEPKGGLRRSGFMLWRHTLEPKSIVPFWCNGGKQHAPITLGCTQALELLRFFVQSVRRQGSSFAICSTMFRAMVPIFDSSSLVLLLTH